MNGSIVARTSSLDVAEHAQAAGLVDRSSGDVRRRTGQSQYDREHSRERAHVARWQASALPTRGIANRRFVFGEAMTQLSWVRFTSAARTLRATDPQTQKTDLAGEIERIELIV
jgi:hypothetical protein